MGGSIDLNADLGEGAGTDAAIMPLITSANIACGGHAGNDNTMRAAVELALRNKVAIGAHPGYPDRERFGRFALDMPADELVESGRRQIDLLAGVAARSGGKGPHVKGQGALVTDPARAAGQALSFVRDGGVTASDGTFLKLAVDTLCLHGDTPGAPDIARAVRDALRDAKVKVASFRA